jgi:peptidoglycan hydrolase-like protein with peptidoglycan-binding domain
VSLILINKYMKNNTNTVSFKIVKAIDMALIAVLFGFVALPIVSYGATLNRQLSLGMSGADVTALQSFLAQDQTLYPQGLVTGYYGFLTKAAVSNFQTRNGIANVGRVGPATLPVLNLQMNSGMSDSNNANYNAARITDVSLTASRNTAYVTWNTSEPTRGWVYYSTSPLNLYERNNNAVDVSGTSVSTDNSLRSSQNITIQNLIPNTTYYYLVYSTNQMGNASLTWPSSFQTSN